jgi:branched-chain amino acid transport system ATP-binding protein
MNAADTLPGLLRGWAERTPDGIALRHKVRSIWHARTWRELHDEVEALAKGLAALGFVRGDELALALDTCPEAALVALAAHWLGGSVRLIETPEQSVGTARHDARGRTGARAHERSARFAVGQASAAAREWLSRGDSHSRVVYVDAHGAWHADERARGYSDLTLREREPGSPPLAPVAADPAVVANGAAYSHLELLSAAEASRAAAQLEPGHEAFASDLAASPHLRVLLPLWLKTGLRLNYAEDAASTRDHDRVELGPTLVVATAEGWSRMRAQLLDRLPPLAAGLGGFARRSLDGSAPLGLQRLLAARVRSASRQALGLGQAQVAMVIDDDADPETRTFFAALGLPLQRSEPPSRTPADAPGPSAGEPRSAASLVVVGEPARAVAVAGVTELSPRARTPLLRLEHISLSFNEVKAVDDISFEVFSHEVCALIGPNGAGKSSLLNVINGIYRPQQGVLHFAGHVHPAMTPRSAAKLGIARTFQNLAIFKGMSVLENVIVGRNLSVQSSWLEQAFGIGRARYDAQAGRERAERVLEFLHLQRYRHTPAAQLPYGLQKRVELARALVAEPTLLLLDEPMAGMNAEEKLELSECILDVNRELGTTVVLIEHDMRVVMDISDHVVVLDYGRLVGDGNPAEVRRNPEVLRAYLGRKRVA